MKQYHFEGNTLVLKVKKSPIFVRAIMFFFSFVFFIAPISGIALSIVAGNRFHFGFLIGLLIFGLVGFYLLRISLWNAYGEEVIELNKPNVSYEANYGWFKDGKKSINYELLSYSAKPIGYEEDKKGALIIEGENTKIESVVKMPIIQIEELIKILNNKSNQQRL